MGQYDVIGYQQFQIQQNAENVKKCIILVAFMKIHLLFF